MLVPIVGVLSSWALFGEVIDGVEALAGLAVVGGVLVGSLPLRRRVRHEPPPRIGEEELTNP